MEYCAIIGIVIQCGACLTTNCNEWVPCLNNRRRERIDLHVEIPRLIDALSKIVSLKEKIDLRLLNSVSIKKSEKYEQVEKSISHLLNKCTKPIDMYTMIIGNQASSTKQPDYPSLSLDTKLSSVIEKLNRLKSSMNEQRENSRSMRKLLWCWRLAKCKIDIIMCIERASNVHGELTEDNMIVEENGINPEKLNDAHIISVFDDRAKEIQNFLRSKEKATVGIYGSAGVGKTAVLTKLHNLVIEDRSKFQHVIWIDYPEYMTTKDEIVEKMQGDIIKKLLPNHEATMTNIEAKAAKISKFLRDKKYIVLIDQVSNCDKLDLDVVGLHHHHMSVVMASTDKNFITKATDEQFEIQGLEEADALTLFQNVCGEINPCNIGIAKRIIKCCGGQPIYITTVAEYLKKKNEYHWNEVVTAFQSKPKEKSFLSLGGLDNIYEKIYEALNACSKKCILYGALFPIQHSIYTDYLIECWIAEGLLNVETAERLRRSRDIGQIILGQLIDQYLMKSCSGKKYVKMEPNFRRVALKLDPKVEKNFIISEGSEFPEPNPDSKVRMTLIGSRENLPTIPEGYDIHTMLLQKKANLRVLHDQFVRSIKRVQVLDLYKTGIEALPESISELQSLKSLYLNGCSSLTWLPPQVERLEKLEFLDIRGSKIYSLPEEIGNMGALRCLRASLSVKTGNRNLQGEEEVELLEIPPSVIKNLVNLEELILDLAPVEKPNWETMAERLVQELATLKNLTTLVFNFPNVKSLDKFVKDSEAIQNGVKNDREHTFSSFKIFIGGQEVQHTYASDFSEDQAKRWLRYSGTKEELSDCRKLLEEASAFEIIGHDGVETLSQFNLHAVEVCVVERCKNLKSIVSTVKDFPVFGKLHLYNLQSLERISNAPRPSQSFTHLKTMTIYGCHKLKKIADPASAHAFKSLRCLRVENCHAISEIVEVQEQTVPSEILGQLTKIELFDLPELQSICNSTSICWKSLNSIIVKGCRNLKNLSLSSTNAPCLASILGEQSWWDNIDNGKDIEVKKGLPFHPYEEENSKEEINEVGASTSGTVKAEDGASTSASGTVKANHEEEIIEVTELDNPIDQLPAALPTPGVSTNGTVEAHSEKENNPSIDPPTPSQRKSRTIFSSFKHSLFMKRGYLLNWF